MAFNQGFFQPQAGGFGQPMQPMFQALATQQIPYQRQAQDQPLFCRAVGSREEMQAWPVDFSGNPMTFLGPNLETVWIKMFNPSTGSSRVIDYYPATPAKNEAQAAPAAPTMDDFQSLRALVEKQGEEISRLRTESRRRSNRETEEMEDV